MQKLERTATTVNHVTAILRQFRLYRRHSLARSTLLVVLSCGITLADGLPLPNYQWPDFVGSANCATCHTGLADAAGHDVSIDTHWRSTMMANSARDPLWQAKVSSEVLRNPTLQSVIEAKCATCHMPAATTQARALGLPVAMSGAGFLNPTNALHAVAMDGITCALCHQITDEQLGEAGSFSGHYTVDTSTSSPDRLIHGPFPNPFAMQMRNSVGFTPVQGLHTTNSALCAVCHNLRTPYVDATGNILGEFPEQMVYSEWEHSAFNLSPQPRECQHCHMPAASGGVKLSNRGGPGLALELRSPFTQHHFVGGNTLLQDIFTNFLGPLGLTASTTNFTATRARATLQLQQQTAALTTPEIRVGAAGLAISLAVNSLVGHKFPAGFPSRRAWLHLSVTDANGEMFFESGRPLPDGSIEGNDADADPVTCEPHWQVITQPQQVQIYEAVMQDSDGNITYTLLRGARYRKDNRLLPEGFDKTTTSADIAPTSDPASDLDFVGGSDRVVYRVATGLRPAPFNVVARLLYQPLARSFANDLFKDTTSAVAAFQNMFNTADKTPVVVAATQASVDPAAAARLGSAVAQSDGQVALSVFAPLLSTNRIESSSNLVHWSTQTTVVQTADPTWITIEAPTNIPSQYYQLRAP